MTLEQEPENKDTINEDFPCCLHSLKGIAGTMEGFKRMQHLTHDMENVFPGGQKR